MPESFLGVYNRQHQRFDPRCTKPPPLGAAESNVPTTRRQMEPAESGSSIGHNLSTFCRSCRLAKTTTLSSFLPRTPERAWFSVRRGSTGLVPAVISPLSTLPSSPFYPAIPLFLPLRSFVVSVLVVDGAVTDTSFLVWRSSFLRSRTRSPSCSRRSCSLSFVGLIHPADTFHGLMVAWYHGQPDADVQDGTPNAIGHADAVVAGRRRGNRIPCGKPGGIRSGREFLARWTMLNFSGEICAGIYREGYLQFQASFDGWLRMLYWRKDGDRLEEDDCGSF